MASKLKKIEASSSIISRLNEIVFQDVNEKEKLNLSKRLVSLQLLRSHWFLFEQYRFR